MRMKNEYVITHGLLFFLARRVFITACRNVQFIH
jgi:hypothetical protein